MDIYDVNVSIMGYEIFAVTEERLFGNKAALR